MASVIAPTSAPVGTYVVKLVVGREEPGAPILHLDLLVEAATGKIAGHGQITQAIAPPKGVIKVNNITGTVQDFTLPPLSRHVTLKGSFGEPPTGIILGFSATLLLNENEWTGRGTFRYGNHTVTDVPVRSR